MYLRLGRFWTPEVFDVTGISLHGRLGETWKYQGVQALCLPSRLPLVINLFWDPKRLPILSRGCPTLDTELLRGSLKMGPGLSGL